MNPTPSFSLTQELQSNEVVGGTKPQVFLHLDWREGLAFRVVLRAGQSAEVEGLRLSQLPVPSQTLQTILATSALAACSTWTETPPASALVPRIIRLTNV